MRLEKRVAGDRPTEESRGASKEGRFGRKNETPRGAQVVEPGGHGHLELLPDRIQVL